MASETEKKANAITFVPAVGHPRVIELDFELPFGVMADGMSAHRDGWTWNPNRALYTAFKIMMDAHGTGVDPDIKLAYVKLGGIVRWSMAREFYDWVESGIAAHRRDREAQYDRVLAGG